jgi:hypothetical protein
MSATKVSLHDQTTLKEVTKKSVHATLIDFVVHIPSASIPQTDAIATAQEIASYSTYRILAL